MSLRARNPTISKVSSSTRSSSPTRSTGPWGNVRRVGRVRRPSKMETGTTAPSSNVAQTVATSPAVAFETGRPFWPSIRWMRRVPSDSGIPMPTWSLRDRGKEICRRSETAPVETINASSTRSSGIESKRWVKRHSRHRATPLTRWGFAGLLRSSRRIRCAVAEPQFSHIRWAAWRREVPGAEAAGTDSVPDSSGPIAPQGSTSRG